MTKYVKMTTSAGDLRIELDDAKAPISVANFLSYVSKGFYDGTIFHRVIKSFMIQGGGFEPGMKQKPTDATIQNEAKNGLKNEKYTLAMARTSAPHSASSQFFINTTNNGLPEQRPGAGRLGLRGVRQGGRRPGCRRPDRLVPTGRKGFHDDVPLADVTIVKAEEVQA
jgi:peptidyl-prolyl cis-trans isomerase B (cyclophilin B)